AGDLVLMGDPLRPLPGLLRLSRQLVRIIRQSIYIFAFGMNGLGMLLGAVGILGPVPAAVFHEAASLAVMLNALRLLWFERWDQTRLGQWTASLAQEMETVAAILSPSRLVYRFMEHWALLVRLGFAVAALFWFLSNLVLISEDEQAVVTRFGRYQTTLTGGLHWRWPAPFERVWREKVYRVRAVQIGFRASGPIVPQTPGYAPPIEWTSEHKGYNYQLVPEESLTLTGEEVPVELTAEVHYRISTEPKGLYKFLFGSSQPESTLRAIAESALREAAARVSLDAILTDQRARIEHECLEAIRRTAERYDLGLQVLTLDLLDIHPPRQVVPAYRQVADALEERAQLVNEAEAYYARKVLSAAGERAIRLLSDTVNRSTHLDTSTTGGVAEWKLTDPLWQQLTQESSDGTLLLSGEAAAKLLAARQARTQRVQKALGAAARFNSLLATYHEAPTLTGVQMYLRTIEESLSGRPLTILDPKVAGRQHLLLADPLFFGNVNAIQQTFPTGRGESPFPREQE
ncbi:MAG: cation-translocating P-type ATPase family protein, partial [Planctomycetes bacterium]|nr:cation-translocating P-type ATPase family protein [Planctomycetota bacterium]